ncbi:hypothetical protein ACH5RR_028941 [Cinchona calisaya]|uniref:Uncharacterized protein n=1 Tax=Cinchona calisaya TaxID=153742 RepID=A0ABD2YQ85_9GENT
MVRTPCIDKNGLKKGAWSEEEDDKLKAYVQRYGHWNWRQLPKFAGLSRCGKSCRLRWMNYLRPGVKRGNFGVQEEDQIIKLHQQFGNRWSVIAAKLPGRTDNEIKNYWHTRLRKRMKTQDSQSSEIMEQYSERSQHMDDAGQKERSSEVSSLYPEQKMDLMEPEMSFLSCDSSSLVNGIIDWLAEDSNNSSVESFTESFESFWTQPFALDTSYNNNNSNWLPAPEEEFIDPFTSFLDGNDIDWFHELIL